MTAGTPQATTLFRFHGSAGDFLPPEKRHRSFHHRFRGTPSVKDRIETLGTPHTEVAFICIDGDFCGFERRLHGGERVEVHGADSPVRALAPRLNDPPGGEPRFVADVNLGRLARLLRLLGFDTLYRNDYCDPEVAAVSATQQRILLTRDRRLLMRREVRHGYFVRSDRPADQAPEVVRRFDLLARAHPFGRCSLCNGLVRKVEKADVLPLLEPRTKRYYDTFWQCHECGQVYWEGSHIEGLQQLMSELALPSG